MTTISPPSWGLNQARLLDLCQAWFEEPVTIRQLYGDSDQNVLITRPNGQRSVLKIRAEHSVEAIDFIEMQVAVLEHLDGGTDGVLTPQPIPTREGHWWLGVEGRNQMQHLAWMLSFIPGDLLDQVSAYSDSLLLDIGRSVATVDCALLNFQDPRTQRQLQWDLANLLALGDYPDRVTDVNRKELLKNWFERIAAEVMPQLAACPRSVIHNDGGNQHNMIVSPPDSVIGIIDFGDTVLTHRICGLGIAAAYACFGHHDPLHAIGMTAAGYHRVLPLSETEQALLPGLAAGRLAMSVAISSHRALLEDDPYITISAEPAWQVLSSLHAMSAERLALVVPQYLESLESQLP